MRTSYFSWWNTSVYFILRVSLKAIKICSWQIFASPLEYQEYSRTALAGRVAISLRTRFTKKSNQKKKSSGMILDSVSWFEEQITRMLFAKATRDLSLGLK